MFHNLNHELIFPLESVCLGIASFSYSSAWAFYYQRIDMGELPKKKTRYSNFEYCVFFLEAQSSLDIWTISFLCKMLTPSIYTIALLLWKLQESHSYVSDIFVPLNFCHQISNIFQINIHEKFLT